MKKIVLTALISLAVAITGFSQKPYKITPAQAREFTVKKQVLADQVESDIKVAPYAAIRVYLRYRFAVWLWSGGKDDSGRAEPLSVKALDELYDKAGEIPENGPDMKAQLFSLLDRNAKETATRLKAKYKYTDDDNLIADAFFDLNKPGGDKRVADKILLSLARGGELDPGITFALEGLRTMRSPQFLVILTAILDAGESGRATTNQYSLSFFSGDFAGATVPLALKRRYFILVLAAARKTLLEPGEDELGAYLDPVMDDFRESLPDLMPEAGAINKALKQKGTALLRFLAEARERVEASTDKIAANIDEAEKASDVKMKSFFYAQALVLAVQGEKYALAIGIIEKERELLKKDEGDVGNDLVLVMISRKALEKDDVETSLLAIGMVRNKIKQAEAWKNAALVFAGKNDAVGAGDALGKSIRILSETGNEDIKRVSALLMLIDDAAKIDKTQVPEVIVHAAKAINDFPTPGADDKPGTKNYERYVVFLMEADRALHPALLRLLAANKTQAIDLAERIQKREIRVFADMLVGIDAFETWQREELRKPGKP
jgi:cell division septum initiation protein DivIVA